jgi:hypothetical protein
VCRVRAGKGGARIGIEVLQGKKDQYEVEMDIYNILTTQANNRSRLYMVILAFGFTSVKKPLSPHFTLSSSFSHSSNTKNDLNVYNS